MQNEDQHAFSYPKWHFALKSESIYRIKFKPEAYLKLSSEQFELATEESVKCFNKAVAWQPPLPNEKLAVHNQC